MDDETSSTGATEPTDPALVDVGPGGDGPPDERPGRLPGLPPTPTPRTLQRAVLATGVGAGAVVGGFLLLRFVVCGDGTCPVGPLRTTLEALATGGFLVLLVGASYGLTAWAHLAAVRRRDERDG
jgi:hypothetical protein